MNNKKIPTSSFKFNYLKTTLTLLLDEYAESHQNKLNKTIHFFCVPLIFFTIFGFLRVIPTPQSWEAIPLLNWGSIAMLPTLGYYLRLSFKLFLIFIAWGAFVLIGNEWLFQQMAGNLVWFSLAVFALAWVGQLYGHHIEGKKPSFLKDLQFLLIGPAWIMNFLIRLEK